MLARATLHSTMSLRVTCLQWFNAELRKAQSLTAVLVGELCKAAYDLLEAGAPLTYKQQQSIRRYTAKLLSLITRATSDWDSQSRIVWPSEETRILSLEDHALISRQCRHLLKGELQTRWCLESLYVYSSIVEPRIIGDKIAPLLRIVPITGRHGEMVTARFDHVQYMPVLSREFGSIETEIRDDTGRPVPLERGKVTVTLHFRRCSSGLFR